MIRTHKGKVLKKFTEIRDSIILPPSTISEMILKKEKGRMEGKEVKILKIWNLKIQISTFALT